MQKTITKPLSILLGFILLFGALCLTGCSSGASSSTNNPSSAEFKPNKDEIKIDQIEWNADSSVVDVKDLGLYTSGPFGNKIRCVVFSYTNNSNYPIIDLECSYSLKEGVSAENVKNAFAASKEYGLSSSDLEKLANLTQEELSLLHLNAESTERVDNGASSEKSVIKLGDNIPIVTMEQYELFEPSIMTIKYLASNGKLYEESYDFKYQTYSLSDKTIDTKQWSDSELASQLPRPESLLISKFSETSNLLNFETICTTQSEFDDYVSACKDKGFTNDATTLDSLYRATSADGKYEVSLSFYSGDSMTVYLNKK